VNCACDTAPIEDDDLDIPEFLLIPQERRAAARARYVAKPVTANNPAIDDRGPGSVCRRAGIPDGINQAFVEAIQAREAAERQVKREQGLTRLAAWKERTRVEQAEIEAVKAAARAQHQKGQKENRRKVARPPADTSVL
jgi:hypothetical protein